MDKKNYILFGIACIVLLIALYLYQSNSKKMEEFTGWVTHTQEVIYQFEKLASDIKSVQIFPANIRKNHKNNLLQYDTYDGRDVQESLKYLRYLTRDNPRQTRRIDTLTKLVNEHLNKILLNELPDTASASYLSVSIKPLILIQFHIDNGVNMEKQLLAKRKEDLDRSQRTTNVLRVIFMATGLLIIIVISTSNIYQISRKNKLEAFLSSVLNTSQTGIIACEAIREKQQIKDFKILFSNKALRDQIELKDGEVMKETLLGISPRTVEIGTFNKYIQVTETGNELEFVISFARGTVVRCYQTYVNKLNDGFIASYSEITELKKSQDQLQKKVTELQQINSELEQFAYVASHDLQEPLRKIKTFSSLVIERFNDPQASFAKVYLNKVIVAASRMTSLINDLLSFSSLSDQSRHFTETDLNKILASVCDDFELAIQEKNAVVTCDPLQDLEAVPLQMNQLFYNLLNNALKFAQQGVPAKIHVSASLLSPEQATALHLDAALTYQEIIVKDNGIGFNQEYAKKIFVIFQRLNSKESFSGTGIGLAICQKIVTNHHGIIYASSKEKQGASFHVVLPLRQPASAKETDVEQ